MSVHSYAGLSPSDASNFIGGSGSGSSFTMADGRVGWITCRLLTAYASGGGLYPIANSITDITDFTGQCEILPGQTAHRPSGQGLVVYDQT